MHSIYWRKTCSISSLQKHYSAKVSLPLLSHEHQFLFTKLPRSRGNINMNRPLIELEIHPHGSISHVCPTEIHPDQPFQAAPIHHRSQAIAKYGLVDPFSQKRYSFQIVSFFVESNFNFYAIFLFKSCQNFGNKTEQQLVYWQ